MKKLLITLSAVTVFGGCRVVEVENRGQAVVRDADGEPVLVDGKPVLVSLGWSVYHNQHWMATQADSLTATVEDGKISFALNGLNSEPSTNLVALVDASLSGVALLAEKVGAAIATQGGSVAKDTVAGAISRYVGNGGKVEGATVKCTDGKCYISDGTISECLNCKDK